jgi:hypothetical protein
MKRGAFSWHQTTKGKRGEGVKLAIYSFTPLFMSLRGCVGTPSEGKEG